MKLSKSTIEKLQRAASILEERQKLSPKRQLSKEEKYQATIEQRRKVRRYNRFLRIKKEYEILSKEFENGFTEN